MTGKGCIHHGGGGGGGGGVIITIPEQLTAHILQIW
jgi:hypothetical protein